MFCLGDVGVKLLFDPASEAAEATPMTDDIFNFESVIIWLKEVKLLFGPTSEAAEAAEATPITDDMFTFESVIIWLRLTSIFAAGLKWLFAA